MTFPLSISHTRISLLLPLSLSHARRSSSLSVYASSFLHISSISDPSELFSQAPPLLETPYYHFECIFFSSQLYWSSPLLDSLWPHSFFYLFLMNTGVVLFFVLDIFCIRRFVFFFFDRSIRRFLWGYLSLFCKKNYLVNNSNLFKTYLFHIVTAYCDGHNVI